MFEFTTDPISLVNIERESQQKSLFPGQSEFLVISESRDLATGDDILKPIDGIVRFDKTEQHDRVACPLEWKTPVFRQGRSVKQGPAGPESLYKRGHKAKRACGPFGCRVEWVVRRKSHAPPQEHAHRSNSLIQ